MGITAIFLLASLAAPAPADTSLAGAWITRGPEAVARLTITDAGAYTIDFDGDGRLDVAGTMTAAGDTVVIDDIGGPLACPNTGRYTARVGPGYALRLTALDDPCEGRRTLVGFVEWAPGDRLADIERTLAERPGDANARLARARIRLVEGDAVGASADLERVMELDSGIAGAYSARAALALLHGEDLAAAEADFTRAIELEPEDGLLRFRRAWARWHMGNAAGACADIQAAMERGLQVRDQYDRNCR